LFAKTADSFISGSGDLAIGHKVPTEKLHVSGNTLIDGNIEINQGRSKAILIKRVWKIVRYIKREVLKTKKN